jgi:ribonuclease HI
LKTLSTYGAHVTPANIQYALSNSGLEWRMSPAQWTSIQYWSLFNPSVVVKEVKSEVTTEFFSSSAHSLFGIPVDIVKGYEQSWIELVLGKRSNFQNRKPFNTTGVSRMIKAYSDGASRGNPGPSSCSYVIYNGEEVIDKGYRYLGEQTNNYAEYRGLLDALSALDTFGYKGADIFCDSTLVVNQVNGIWKIKHLELMQLCHLAQALLIVGKHTLSHVDGHKGIAGNELADQLCNECLDAIQWHKEANDSAN